MRIALLALLATGLFADGDSATMPAIAVKLAGLQPMPGLLPLVWDANAGKLYLEISRFNQDLLYTHSLPWGVGSKDLELDRGQPGDGVVVQFRRVGPKVLLVAPNLAFRSLSSDAAERLAVQQSFPESVLWGFKVEAANPDGTVLVDATDFFERDVHGVAERLKDRDQGEYTLDTSRSTIAPEATKAFPKNTEVEAILTFVTGSPKGEFVQQVTPDPHALTVREHQSFIELPGPGYVPRRFDPRAGLFPLVYRDYTASLSGTLDQKLILRHRLIKKDPACETNCEPVEPLRYYIDRGAPEPLRTALLEGVRWWNQAFTNAGWKDAFQVDMLPENADPMDVRYNVIQWVHRYTRGWSIGNAVIDPRTGEIVRGVVTLGSLRARQDYLIAEALLSPYEDGKPLPEDKNPMLQMVLARVRQLAAHETGHTLGLAHNFVASTFAQGASVMDYPHPLVTIGADGKPDVSNAYAVNIGEWDKVAIDYGYRQFAPGQDENAGLDAILANAMKRGLYFITDEDARPLGSAHPYAHLWDNGADPVAELRRVVAVRKVALRRFGTAAIKNGTPYAQLEDTLVVLYLMHRYQTEAAAKSIGGLDYRYALRGDGQKIAEIVPSVEQRKALSAVLETIAPAFLTLPEPLLRLLPPRSFALPRTPESFPAETGLTFDPVATAEASADLTLALLFDPARAARLVQYHARDAQNPGLEDLLDAALQATWMAPKANGLALTVQQATQMQTVEAMLSLAANASASSETRAIVRSRLHRLKLQITDRGPIGAAAAARIDEFERNPKKFTPASPVKAPEGMPIGDDEE